MNNNISKKVIINLIWSITELYKFSPYYVFIILLDGLLKGISPIISLLLTNKLINELQLQQDSLQHIILLLGLLILFEIFNSLCSSITQLKLSNYELKFDTFIKCKILNKVSELDSKNFENSSTYDLIDRTQYDANTGILENLKRKDTVLRSLKKTALDNVAGHISLVFGLVYEESIKIVSEQGYLDQLMNFKSKNAKTNKQFEEIREVVKGYIKRI